MNQPLKPCPFCGSDKIEVIYDDGGMFDLRCAVPWGRGRRQAEAHRLLEHSRIENENTHCPGIDSYTPDRGYPFPLVLIPWPTTPKI